MLLQDDIDKKVLEVLRNSCNTAPETANAGARADAAPAAAAKTISATNCRAYSDPVRERSSETPVNTPFFYPSAGDSRLQAPFLLRRSSVPRNSLYLGGSQTPQPPSLSCSTPTLTTPPVYFTTDCVTQLAAPEKTLATHSVLADVILPDFIPSVLPSMVKGWQAMNPTGGPAGFGAAYRRAKAEEYCALANHSLRKAFALGVSLWLLNAVALFTASCCATSFMS